MIYSEPVIEKFKSWNEERNTSNRYMPLIKTCMKNNSNQNDDKNGQIEWDCAIKVATSFYKTDTELALKICIKYSSDDMNFPKNVMRTSCTSLLEKHSDNEKKVEGDEVSKEEDIKEEVVKREQ